MSEIFFFFFFFAGFLLKLVLLPVFAPNCVREFVFALRGAASTAEGIGSFSAEVFMFPRELFSLLAPVILFSACNLLKNLRSESTDSFRAVGIRTCGRSHFDSDATAHFRLPSLRYLESKSNTAP